MCGFVHFLVIPAVSLFSAGSLSWTYFSLATRVHVGLWCQRVVVGAALWDGHSCRSGSGLDGLRSEGAEAVRANHESAESFLFRPHICSVKKRKKRKSHLLSQ